MGKQIHFKLKNFKNTKESQNVLHIKLKETDPKHSPINMKFLYIIFIITILINVQSYATCVNEPEIKIDTLMNGDVQVYFDYEKIVGINLANKLISQIH